MRLITCDICGKEITKSYQTVTDFDQFYDVCKECEKKFNSYKKEKEELYSSIKKEFDIKFNKKEKNYKKNTVLNLLKTLLKIIKTIFNSKN